MPGAAFATLLTKTSYLAGVLVLDHGLKKVDSKYPLVVLATPELPQAARDVLSNCGIKIRDIQPLRPEEGTHSLSAADVRFHDTWTKLRVFELAEYDRVVLLDCDMLVKRNMDDLMELELPVGGIAACHACACNPRKFPHYPKDWVPENCGFSAVSGPAGAQPVPSDSPRPHNLLNSGTVVLEPSIELAQQMYHFLATDERVPSFSFPDQDLLAAFFHGKWRSINWYYNALRTLRTVHAAIWDDDLVRCVHYILADKPWQVRDSKEFAVVNGWWWEQYEDMSRQLDSEALALVSSIVAPA